MEDQNPLITPGTFLVGSNYLASHAGTAMWSDWRPDLVAAEVKRLADAGMRLIRVFPIWPDFQPLTYMHSLDSPSEFRLGEDPLPDTEAGRAGLSQEVMDRFGYLLDVTHQQGLRAIVALVTGWMSGRQFVPPGLEGRDPLTDPLALIWETRFVRHLVRTFHSHPAILAWDLGNECNCMGQADREQAWVWASAIANAIRSEDRTRPVVSGMHGLTPAIEGPWRIQDQGELTDVMVTHPYPYFTKLCDQDPVNTIRPLLHSAAESRLHSDIAGKPCLIEEVNVLGPWITTEEIAADFLRTVLFSAWAHDCHGVLWWASGDYAHLTRAPYDWWAFERELGLFRSDGTFRPVLTELSRFRQFLDGLPLDVLPQRTTEAVCILTIGQDNWPAAFSSFILAKQAGFDLTFQYADQPVKDAPLYMLPSISTARALPRRRWLDLLGRAHAGATLYVSHNDGMLHPFTEPFGVDVVFRQRRHDTAEVILEGLPGVPRFVSGRPFRLGLHASAAEVLGREPDGNPVFTRAVYGKGALYFLSVPIEHYLATIPDAFHAPQVRSWWQVYRQIAQPVLECRAVTKDHPYVGLTEHSVHDHRRVVIAVNYAPEPSAPLLTLAKGWRLDETWYGVAPTPNSSGLNAAIGPNDALVITVCRA